MSDIEQKIRDILYGIDKREVDDEMGWWPTSSGANFGKEKLDEVIAAVKGHASLETKDNRLDIMTAPQWQLDYSDWLYKNHLRWHLNQFLYAREEDRKQIADEDKQYQEYLAKVK